ncbi:MAG TPA: thiol reductant ABC exporter subunit CydD [Mycobacterium sp.]|nr:thiol reductant ABC exporter subunit CydD [Mycobacterium sp.]HPX37876.1 thiol reductant ABC exporter subunit CydD [Mycobacterium sp.]HQC77631.1 thiol reductant ABC exporter subunit CydD [Mycobacterium sp.]HQE14794.1 thiol reductant ABC exporter subunit CydD [Mycobacterium sp.]
MRRYLVAAVCCGLLIAGSAIASATVLGRVIAGIITDPGARSIAVWRGSLLILAALWAVRAVGQWLQARLGQSGASAVIADLNSQVLRSVTALPPNQLAPRREEAATLIASGLDGLRPYFTAYLPALLLAALLTPAAATVIAVNDPRSALIVLVALPLIPIFMALIGVATAERSSAALAATTVLQSRLMDLIAGIPTLRALGRVGGPADRIAALNAAHRRSTMATLRIAFLSSLVLELIATLGVAMVAVSIGLRLLDGELALSTGLTVLLLAPDVFWPLRRVGIEFHAAQNGKAAADRAFALIDSKADAPDGTRTIQTAGATIRLRQVSVAGRDGVSPYRLSGCIAPGRVTVLTGPNGAGKSTALQVIAGLIPPTEGAVEVDGVTLTDIARRNWWRQLSWLAQRPVIIPGTVEENLNLFGPLSDFDTIRTTGFDQVLSTLPQGMDSAIGQGGQGLSLGQRQRLGLARVLGSGAPLLLLDEPTAHLDDAAEAAVLQSISARAAAGATVVVVAHRPSILAIADQVIEVESVANALL